MACTRTPTRWFVGAIGSKEDYARTQIADGAGDPSYELIPELGYRFHLSRFLFVQPDLQGVMRPAGTGKIPSAIVAGAETASVHFLS